MVDSEEQRPELGRAAVQARRGDRTRGREEDDAEPHSVEKEICPPHPGFMRGLCFRCGESRQVSSESVPQQTTVHLRYIDGQLELSDEEAARMRKDELKQAMRKQKLYLVIDLDHTMLNSALFTDVLSEEEASLAACYSTGDTKGLHKLKDFPMWTKLRPFAQEFIAAASEICEMYIYTMGARAYAVEMARLLDPERRFFDQRIISQGDSTCSTIKDLDVVLGAESVVVILDDTERVWPKHRANLVLMERYHFFRSSCKQFRVQGLSLTEKGRDESEMEGALAMTLNTLRCVHRAFFSDTNHIERGILRKPIVYEGVTKVIQSLRRGILKGCHVVFSHIFPIGTDVESHPFWRLTAKLGAHCSTATNSSTTHVISLDRGTEKARWAKQNGTFLVHPCWVEAANYLWCRPCEVDFPVRESHSPPPRTYFAKTVPVICPSRPETHTNGDFTPQLLEKVRSELIISLKKTEVECF